MASASKNRLLRKGTIHTYGSALNFHGCFAPDVHERRLKTWMCRLAVDVKNALDHPIPLASNGSEPQLPRCGNGAGGLVLIFKLINLRAQSMVAGSFNHPCFKFRTHTAAMACLPRACAAPQGVPRERHVIYVLATVSGSSGAA